MKMLARSTIERARRYITEIPGAVSGAGGHNQTFAVACALVHGFALPEYEALLLLREYNAKCQPPWSEADLQHKIKSALAASHAKPRGHLLGAAECRFERRGFSGRHTFNDTPKIKIDPATATENFLRGFRCTPADLTAASTCKIPPLICGPHFHRQGVYLLDQLFEPDELVNIVTESIVESGKARPRDSGLTLERAGWEQKLLRRDTLQSGDAWVRMNPLDGRGVADANVTAFRFALIECDSIPLELQLSLLAKLPLPIAAIINSGGRSIHGWVRVDANTLDDYRDTVSRMLALLTKFGVDGKNKNPSRMSRLPGAVRRIGAVGDGRQRLLYLNPEPKQQTIL